MEPMGLDEAYFIYKYLWSQPNTMKLFSTGSTKKLEEAEERVTNWSQRWKNEDPFSGMSVRNKHSGDYVGFFVLGHRKEHNSSEIVCALRDDELNKGYGYECVGASVLFLSKILKKNNFKVNDNQ